jgi:Methyltransferase FkbM domain
LDTALKGESPSLIKIDMEGYETPVLKDAEETLAKSSLHSVIVELNGSGNRYGFDESAILEMMQDHRFKSYSYDPFKRSIINLQTKNFKSGNTLFIKNESFVIDRIMSAPRVVVNRSSF